jgi:hypothetical protein
MIGRKEDVRSLVESLRAGANQIVGGPRRTGKTTVCEAAVAGLAKGAYTVSIDLFRMGDIGELSDALILRTISNRPVIRKALGGARTGIRALGEHLRLAPVLRLKNELGADLEVAFAAKAGDPEKRFDAALTLMCRLAEADSRQLILYIDEAQEIGRTHSPFGDADRITKRMRSILQGAPHVNTLFAGSQEHLLMELFTPKHRAFHGWASWVTLEPIAADAWERGLTTRFRQAGVSIEATALDRLVAAGEGHARSTMLIAQQSALAAVFENASTVDDALVEVGIDRAMGADSALHQEVMAELRRLGKHVPAVVRAIAGGEAPYGSRGEALAPNAVQRALEAASKAGVVAQRGARGTGGWVIVDPLLRRYLV